MGRDSRHKAGMCDSSSRLILLLYGVHLAAFQKQDGISVFHCHGQEAPAVRRVVEAVGAIRITGLAVYRACYNLHFRLLSGEQFHNGDVFALHNITVQFVPQRPPRPRQGGTLGDDRGQ